MKLEKIQWVNNHLHQEIQKSTNMDHVLQRYYIHRQPLSHNIFKVSRLKTLEEVVSEDSILLDILLLEWEMVRTLSFMEEAFKQINLIGPQF